MIFYFALRAILIGALAYSIIRGMWENAFTCLLTLGLMMIPTITERRMKIELPTVMEVVVIAFVFAANFLGEIGSFYNRIPVWDSALHSLNGFICAGVGFGLTDILNRNDKVKLRLSPIFVALFSFCFSMTAGIMWEFFEFGMDSIFKTDMQKDTLIQSIYSYKLSGSETIGSIKNITDVAVNGRSIGGGYIDTGLIDTMKDLLLNFAGAVIFNTAGYFYLKTRRKKAGFIKNFIPQRKSA